MQFASDNTAPMAPEILEALTRANEGAAPAYGADDWCAAAECALRELFETDCSVFFVATGTAANGLALAALSPSYGAVFCHEASHIQVDECGAPEFYTGGAKLIPLPGADGRLAPETLSEALELWNKGEVHHSQPAALSLTQATEWGTVYSPDQLRALTGIARGAGLAVHMDGARFANAVAALGCSAAEASWKAGVDILCLGATKGGALAAEAVLVFNPEQGAALPFLRKRAGHLLSKSRFFGAQWVAYLQDGLWLRLAGHANAMARRLEAGLKEIDGVTLYAGGAANGVFAALPMGMAEALTAKGARFYPWIVPGDPAEGRLIRLVTSFATAEADVDRFLAEAAAQQGAGWGKV